MVEFVMANVRRTACAGDSYEKVKMNEVFEIRFSQAQTICSYERTRTPGSGGGERQTLMSFGLNNMLLRTS